MWVISFSALIRSGFRSYPTYSPVFAGSELRVRWRYLTEHASRSSTKPINNIDCFHKVIMWTRGVYKGESYTSSTTRFSFILHQSVLVSTVPLDIQVYPLRVFRIILFSKLGFSDHSRLPVPAFNNLNYCRCYGQILV